MEEQGVDGADASRLRREDVAEGESGLLQRNGEIQPAHVQPARVREGFFEGRGCHPVAKVEVWQVGGGKGLSSQAAGHRACRRSAVDRNRPALQRTHR